MLAIPVILSGLSHKSSEQVQAMEEETAINKFGLYFQEASGQSGVNFIHHSPELDPAIDHILPQIASMGAAVAVCDFD